MTTFFNNGLFSELTYLITQKEYNEFVQLLTKITTLKHLSQNIFDQQKSKLQRSIIRVSKIREIKKKQIPENIQNYKYVKILPVYSRKRLENILQEININEKKWIEILMFY